eukprot:scaffold151806_cov26-Tisochrysis_lutea.AAC.2
MATNHKIICTESVLVVILLAAGRVSSRNCDTARPGSENSPGASNHDQPTIATSPGQLHLRTTINEKPEAHVPPIHVR